MIFLVTAQSSFEINRPQQPSKSIRSCNKTAAKDVDLTVFYFHEVENPREAAVALRSAKQIHTFSMPISTSREEMLTQKKCQLKWTRGQ